MRLWNASMTPIAATLTRDRHAQALVTLNGGPFNGVDIYPADLRRMAQQLAALADMATKLPTGGKHWKPTRVAVVTTQINPTTASVSVIPAEQIDATRESRLAGQTARLKQSQARPLTNDTEAL